MDIVVKDDMYICLKVSIESIFIKSYHKIPQISSPKDKPHR